VHGLAEGMEQRRRRLLEALGTIMRMLAPNRGGSKRLATRFLPPYGRLGFNLCDELCYPLLQLLPWPLRSDRSVDLTLFLV
jgi:hypothetical protein